jgi:hypothetical protein
MRGILAAAIAFLILLPPAVLALEPTSPGVLSNLKGASSPSLPNISNTNQSTESERTLAISFWHQSPTGSLGLLDAITGAVTWQPLHEFRTAGSPDTLFPCRFAFRCSINNRIVKYCNVLTDNKASYRMNIDVNGLLHVSVSGPGRQSVSFEAEGIRKKIYLYGQSNEREAWCGIDP